MKDSSVLLEVDKDIHEKYELVVGLEVHVQLATQSKAFCNDPTEFGASPNSQVGPVTAGMPGALPFLNEKVVNYAVKMGLAMHCKIREYNYFARKNYFYPDLPKGYQISQSDTPICYDGYLDIKGEKDDTKRISIERIHMEEDAGKNIHDQDLYDSMIDLNRAGIPLIEIVSAPDISSSKEAHAYLFEIRKLLRYLEISDGNMEEGSLRCDANISVRLKGDKKLNNRCEVKNLNSFKNVQKAIEFEFQRQVALMENGIEIETNTLHFDLETGVTSPTRSKEMANDYRYFPEPDLIPIHIDKATIDTIQDEMPLLPEKLVVKLQKEYGLGEYDIQQLSNEKEIADYFLALATHTKNYKSASNWIMGPIRSYLNEHAITSVKDFPLPPEKIAELIALIDEGALSFTNASNTLFPLLVENSTKGVRELAEANNLLIASIDDKEIEEVINRILDEMPQKVNEYLSGKKGLLGLFMGKLMQAFKGQLNPGVANKLIQNCLEKRKK